MATEKSLEDEVKGLIEPWRNDDNEPPFSYGELVTMALLLTKKEMNMRDIAAWVASTFKYYHHELFALYWQRAYEDWNQGRSETDGCFIDDLWDAMHDYDLPVDVACPEGYEEASDWECYSFKIWPLGARHYLKRILPYEQKGHLPFPLFAS